MRVVKLEKPIVAYVFKIQSVTDGGVEDTNFAELEADVKADGGTVEKVSDDLVVVKVGGAEYTLPLGFAVLPSMAGKIVSAGVFEQEYAELVGDDGFDLESVVGLIDRVGKLEVELVELVALSGRLTAVETVVAGLDGKVKVSAKGKPEPEKS